MDAGLDLSSAAQHAPHAEALVAAAPSVRKALQAARYHQIRHVREAAVPALADLNALAPEPTATHTPRPALEPVRGRRPARSASRKGPWLHQQLASASPARDRALPAQARTAMRRSLSPLRRRSSRCRLLVVHTAVSGDCTPFVRCGLSV